MINEIIGYKGFNENLTCKNDFQYEIGKSYEMEDEPILCERGYHFCKTIKDVFKYYPSNCRICKVRVYGDTDTDNYDNNKFCTNKIEILEEVSLSKEDRIKYAYANAYRLSNTELEELLKEEFVLDKYINDKDWYVRKVVAKLGYGLDKLINDKNPGVRVIVAYQGYGLDILVNDESWQVREAVVEQGYGLDKLINDKDWYVRAAVVKQRYGLDKLVNDKSALVRRAVAEQGYGLDILVNDESWQVRATVALQGYCLDKLANDEDPDVKLIAKVAANKLKEGK